MSEEPLAEDEVDRKLQELEIWGQVGDKLATEIEFNSYKEAVFFANTVFSVAEKQFHHPKVTVEYGSVIIDVTTHEAEGLTEKDFEFAKEVEENLGEMDWS
ncbi:4a-hydroxytetrahydrobiopterin dehydratase [Candidatus Nanohalococcus occultus]|uniref:4a-hydroxytetrahydrobiopterin dehydratase n=1 Tax=Candidatus Nanohalococcus occultus TaxID=2978047 RepID=UPI0039DFF83C